MGCKQSDVLIYNGHSIRGLPLAVRLIDELLRAMRAPQEWIWSSRAEPSLIGLSVLVNEGTVPVVTLQVNV